jgi:hypothetical protein
MSADRARIRAADLLIRCVPPGSLRITATGPRQISASPHSSGDRATASGAVCAGSNPAGGALPNRAIRPLTSPNLLGSAELVCSKCAVRCGPQSRFPEHTRNEFAIIGPAQSPVLRVPTVRSLARSPPRALGGPGSSGDVADCGKSSQPPGSLGRRPGLSELPLICRFGLVCGLQAPRLPGGCRQPMRAAANSHSRAGRVRRPWRGWAG